MRDVVFGGPIAFCDKPCPGVVGPDVDTDGHQVPLTLDERLGNFQPSATIPVLESHGEARRMGHDR